MKKNIFQNEKLIKTISLSLLAILVLSSPLFFQQSPVEMSGKIMYEDKTAVDDAVISILNVNDRSLVTSGITDLDGTFKFDQIEEGKYLISIQVLDQPHKIYGPLNIGAKQSHLLIKTLILPVPAAKKKIAANYSVYNQNVNI